MRLFYVPIIIGFIIPITSIISIFANDPNDDIPVRIQIKAVLGKDNKIKTPNGDVIGTLKKETEVFDLGGKKIGNVTQFNNEEPSDSGD